MARPRAAADDPAPRALLESGTRLGNYVVEGALGAGAQGMVYVARDVVLGRRAALKILHAANESAQSAFAGLEEARLVATLDHRNVIRLYHVDRASFGWYVAMELCEGGSLSQRLRSSRAFPAEAVVKIGAAIAGGLHHAHSAGLIHRDVKPGNVLLTKTGVVKVADFGLALRMSSRAAEAMGTPAYSAPELWEGSPATVSSDLFSFGATLYCLLEGTPPFAGRTGAELVAAMRSRPVTFSVENLPEPLARVIRECLDPEPARRPPSAEAAFHALRAMTAPPPAPVRRTPSETPAEPAAELVMWSADAVRLAAHYFDRSSEPALLVGNALAVRLALGLGMVTSYCVVVAAHHSRAIANANDLSADERVMPALWPSDEVLSLLARLR